VREGKLVSSPF